MEVMKGVKAAIKNNLPQEWDYVLRKNRCLTRAIDYIYNSCIPDSWKNKYMYHKSIQRITHLVRNFSITECFDASLTDEGYAFWLDIEEQITNYKEQCR